MNAKQEQRKHVNVVNVLPVKTRTTNASISAFASAAHNSCYRQG